MSTKLRTCSGCNEALSRAEFSKNQWLKGPGTSRCKGCVSGAPPASAAAAKKKNDTPSSGAVTPASKPPSALPSSTDFGRSGGSAAGSVLPAAKKAVEKTPDVKPSGPQPTSTTFGKAKTKKAVEKTPDAKPSGPQPTSTTFGKAKNKKAAAEKKGEGEMAISAVQKDKAPSSAAGAAPVPASAPTSSTDQKSGEPSTEVGNSPAKKVKVKTSKEGGRGGVGKFFGGLVKGLVSWIPAGNPCLKAITGQVVTEEDAKKLEEAVC